MHRVIMIAYKKRGLNLFVCRYPTVHSEPGHLLKRLQHQGGRRRLLRVQR